MVRTPLFLLAILASSHSVRSEDQAVPFPEVAMPGYLESLTDPTFGSNVTRVTGDVGELIPNVDARWDAVARHGYSKEAAWNADQTLLLLRQHHGFPSMIFLNGQSYEPVFGRNLGPGSELRWHPREPDTMVYVKDHQIGKWYVREETTEVVATFDDYAELQIGPWEGNLSHDGKMIGISAKKDGKRVGFAYDLENGTKSSDLELPVGTDWISVSASGKHLVVNGHFNGNEGDQTQVYDLRGKPVGELWAEFGRPSHYDLTMDADGADIAVGVSKSQPDLGRVIKRRLTDGAVTVLTSGGFAGHTSTRNIQRQGWAYVTYQYRGTDWLPYRDEVVAVKLDGSLQVERIAHLHSLEADYLTQAHAVPSPDGTHVLWASSWGEASGRPVRAFVAEFEPR